MEQLNWPAIILVLAGVGIRLATYERFIKAHGRAYGRGPQRGWLWTSVDNPEVERLRRIMVLGSVLAIAGLVLFVLRFVPTS